MVLVVAVTMASGCIEYFAEPPDLGPWRDGGADAAVASELDSMRASASDAAFNEDSHSAIDSAPLDDRGPACTPSDEVCDSIDNDCDGDVDEQLRYPCNPFVLKRREMSWVVTTPPEDAGPPHHLEGRGPIIEHKVLRGTSLSGVLYELRPR